MPRKKLVVKDETIPAEQVDAGNDEAEALEKEVDEAVRAPEGVKTGKVGVPVAPKVSKNKDGVLTIAPSGRFESIDNLIFNALGQHVGTEENENVAARKAQAFNTHRKFRN